MAGMKEKGREIKDAADRAVVCICQQQSSEDAMLLRIQRWLYLISLIEFVLFQGERQGQLWQNVRWKNSAVSIPMVFASLWIFYLWYILIGKKKFQQGEEDCFYEERKK